MDKTKERAIFYYHYQHKPDQDGSRIVEQIKSMLQHCPDGGRIQVIEDWPKHKSLYWVIFREKPDFVFEHKGPWTEQEHQIEMMLGLRKHYPEAIIIPIQTPPQITQVCDLWVDNEADILYEHELHVKFLKQSEASKKGWMNRKAKHNQESTHDHN